ncbi:unnamed protein product, partial [Prorocentrum cordatum]
HELSKYVHALSKSSLTYNRHVWGKLTATDRNHIAAKYTKSYTVAVGPPKANSPKHLFISKDVVALTGVPEFGHHQWAARVRYLPRLLNHAPIQLLQLLGTQAAVEHEQQPAHYEYLCYVCGITTRTKNDMDDYETEFGEVQSIINCKDLDTYGDEAGEDECE